MKVIHYRDIPNHDLAVEGAEGVKIRVLINADDGAPNFLMMQLEVGPGGHTPFHTHDWEEEIYVQEGEGKLKTDQGETPLKPGDCVFLDPGLRHQFISTGSNVLAFICSIPRKDV